MENNNFGRAIPVKPNSHASIIQKKVECFLQLFEIAEGLNVV